MLVDNNYSIREELSSVPIRYWYHFLSI
jgi:hypothetical protein